MSLHQRLDDDLKRAIKSSDKLKTSVLRMVKAAIKNRQVEKLRELSEEEIISVILTLSKQRRESIELFSKGGREDLADKEKQEISVIGRLLSIEALLIVMGLVCLVSGIVTGESMQLFWGGMIIGGSVILYFVKKKDWKKHWEEQERIQKVYMEMRRLEEEKKEREKKDD